MRRADDGTTPAVLPHRKILCKEMCGIGQSVGVLGREPLGILKAFDKVLGAVHHLPGREGGARGLEV